MLGKLLKYEIKATARIFLPLFGLIIVLAVVNKIFMPLNHENFQIPQAISMSVYCVLVAAMFVMTLVVTIQRFYKNLLGDEGYLSFTLPVRTHSHIDSKMIVALLWSVLSVVVMALSIFIMVIDREGLTQVHEFFTDVALLYSRYGMPAVLLTIEGIVLVLVSILSGVVEIYAAITIGNLVPKHKLLAGFGSYIGFGVIQQIIVSIFMTASNNQLRDYFESFHYSGNEIPFQPIATALTALLVFCLVFGLIFYFLTDWLLHRKLNLE